MKILPFVAENAAVALARIHEQLGLDAMVLSMRRLPAHGLARLWNPGGQVEVLAGVLTEKEQEVADGILPAELERATRQSWAESVERDGAAPVLIHQRAWQSINRLESLGLMSNYADQLEQRVCARYGQKPPTSSIAEWTAVRDTLGQFWNTSTPTQECWSRPHVFIGPPGSGKTTALCKWLTLAVLAEERTARVWRLDGDCANASEFLTIHCELLGVPLARGWSQPAPADILFVDFPGVEVTDPQGLAAVGDQLASLPSPHVHLVLNAAYETSVLFDQLHRFAQFRPQDVLFTHLDEEPRRVKLWNFVLGTNCSLSYLSAGQKIPGQFQRAEPASLFPHENCR